MGWQPSTKYQSSILPMNKPYIALSSRNIHRGELAYIKLSATTAYFCCSAHTLKDVTCFSVGGHFDQFPLDGEIVTSVICLTLDLLPYDFIHGVSVHHHG